MNKQSKTPKSVYVTLGAGIALGALCMAGIYGVNPANFSAFGRAYGSDNHLPSFQPRNISAPSRESVTEMKNADAFYENLAKFVKPAVVDIMATSGRQMGPNGERMPTSGGEGSGFILRPDGYIVTNDHVVGGFDNVKVTLMDGREFDGKVTRAHDSDIAIVKIDAKDLPTLAFGDSNKLEVGQQAMAVGAPFGLVQSVTFGHISALGREGTQIENRYYPDMIQTDTAINMGNSGGPLCNIDGQVIGLNTAIYSPSGTSAGIGFCIPSNQVRLIADKLIETGKIVRSQIGIIPHNLTEYQKSQKHLQGGALVVDAPEGKPAGMAGIKKDDIIVRIGRTPITSELDLRNAMLEYAPNSTVDVEFVRNGVHKTVKVKLDLYKEPTEADLQKSLRPSSPNGFGAPRGFDSPDQFFKDFPGFGEQLQPKKSAPSSDGKAHLGVSIGNVTDEVRQQFSIPSTIKGAVVEDVQSGSVAEGLGLQPGDVIQKLGDRTINSAEDLTSAMAGVKPGDKRHIKYSRYGNGVMTIENDVTF